MSTPNDVLEYLDSLLADLEADERDAQQRLDEVQQRVQSLRTTRDYVATRQRAPGISRSDLASVANGVVAPIGGAAVQRSTWARKLQGLKQYEALRRIAEENEGHIVNASEARDILIAAGLVHGKPRNAGSHLYNLLKDSEEFEKVSPGNFRLRSKAPLFDQSATNDPYEFHRDALAEQEFRQPRMA